MQTESGTVLPYLEHCPQHTLVGIERIKQLLLRQSVAGGTEQAQRTAHQHHTMLGLDRPEVFLDQAAQRVRERLS